jgi:hypothetical protein
MGKAFLESPLNKKTNPPFVQAQSSEGDPVPGRYLATWKKQLKSVNKMVNNNYTTAKYTVAITVAKSPDDVFNHLIHDVSKFWPEDFDGESSKLGDEFIFTSGDLHYSKNKVAELVPGKKVVWLVTESIRKTDNFDWSGTKMIFELTPKGNTTLLNFTYDGLVLDGEYDRLVEVCNMVFKEILYNFLTDAQAK